MYMPVFNEHERWPETRNFGPNLVSVLFKFGKARAAVEHLRLLPGGFWKDRRNGDGDTWEEPKGPFQRTLEVIFFLPTRKE